MDSPADDPTIRDEDALVRQVPPGNWIRELGTGVLRPTSDAFSESSDGSGMSTNLVSILTENGLPLTFVAPSIAAKRVGWGSVQFGVAYTREQGGRVKRHALPDNPAHAAVFGLKKAGRTRLTRNSKVIDYGKPSAR